MEKAHNLSVVHHHNNINTSLKVGLIQKKRTFINMNFKMDDTTEFGKEYYLKFPHVNVIESDVKNINTTFSFYFNDDIPSRMTNISSLNYQDTNVERDLTNYTQTSYNIRSEVVGRQTFDITKCIVKENSPPTSIGIIIIPNPTYKNKIMMISFEDQPVELIIVKQHSGNDFLLCSLHPTVYM